MAAGRYTEFDSDFFKTFSTLPYYLNKGAYGNVYGPIPWLGLKLALKEIKFEDEKIADILRKKMEEKKLIWTSLENEHLTRIHSVELSGLPKVLFIVMEFAAGGSLDKALGSLGSEKKLPIHVVTDWAKQLAEGMLYLHDRSIVHRDLKPSNILLMETFDVRHPHVTLRIADFDDVKEHNYTQTMSGMVGTCAYMAPEVLQNQRFSKASDVWSYGVLVWEMLSGEIPHNGIDEHTMIRKSIMRELKNLPLQPQFPEDYKLFLSRCWEPASRERPSFRDIFCVLQHIEKKSNHLKETS